jgi:quinol-cytochrome oxidoreductase complex cytochrome b subunit
MFQALKYLPATIAGIPGELFGIVGFGVIGLVIVLVPFLDRKASSGRSSPWWNRIGILFIVAALVLTVLALLPPPGAGAS